MIFLVNLNDLFCDLHEFSRKFSFHRICSLFVLFVFLLLLVQAVSGVSR